MEPTRTLICLPCMDMVSTQFLRSLISMRKVGSCNFAITTSSLIYDARNLLAAKAVEGGFDRVLWLDSDMTFDSDFMERLSADLDEGREFVTGLYFTRKKPTRPVLFSECAMMIQEDGLTQPAVEFFKDYPKNEIFEVKACGFGGVMMTVDLLKRVIDRYGQPFTPVLGFGEDLSFCGRVQKLGVPMWCDSRVKMGHVGFKEITERDYLEVTDG